MTPDPEPSDFDAIHGHGDDAAILALRRRVTEGIDHLRTDAERLDAADLAAEFAAWLLRAVRLAAVGDPEGFDQWPALASELGIDVASSIRHAALDGLETLDDARGERLAEAVIDAEDAACLRLIEPRRTDLLIDEAFDRILLLWVDAAEGVLTDEDAASVLDSHRTSWAVPAEARLSVIETPLGALEHRLGAVSPSRAIRLAPIFEHAEELAMFDGGRPTDGMIRRFAARRGRGETPSGRDLEVEGSLDPHWQITVWIRGTASALVRGVRIGTRALEIHPDFRSSMDAPDDDGPDGGNDGPARPWSVSLAGLPLEVRTRLICGDVAISTVDGGRFLI
jgi:hypothetical protein